jgi:hypothetical protein
MTAVDDQNTTTHVDVARELVAEDKSRQRAMTTNHNQPLTGAFSHVNIPGWLWCCPCQPVSCVTGAVSLCPPPPSLGHQKAGNSLRSRHKSLNGQLKNWEILKSMYCHDIMEHGNGLASKLVSNFLRLITVMCTIMNEIRILYSIVFY